MPVWKSRFTDCGVVIFVSPLAAAIAAAAAAPFGSKAKAGKVEYRADKDGNVNLAVGKVSFDTKKLVENVNTVIQQILKIKPASIKGAYVTCCVIHTTMGPSVKVVCE